jgi:hypothetical protein
MDFALHILIRGNINKKENVEENIDLQTNPKKSNNKKQRPQKLSHVAPKVVINHKKI